MAAAYHGARTNKTVQLCLRQEAEYLAASNAAKEGRSFLKLANNILNKEVKAINISVDNRAAELWTRQPCQPSKTKQIDIFIII